MPEAVAPEVRADANSARPLRVRPRGFAASQDHRAADAPLMLAWSRFMDAHNELDRILDAGTEPDENRVFHLNGLWRDACVAAASYPAATPEGRRAKATMLLAVMDVLLGESRENCQLHEILATSLARDCCPGEPGIPSAPHAGHDIS